MYLVSGVISEMAQKFSDLMRAHHSSLPDLFFSVRRHFCCWALFKQPTLCQEPTLLFNIENCSLTLAVLLLGLVLRHLYDSNRWITNAVVTKSEPFQPAHNQCWNIYHLVWWQFFKSSHMFGSIYTVAKAECEMVRITHKKCSSVKCTTYNREMVQRR